MEELPPAEAPQAPVDLAEDGLQEPVLLPPRGLVAVTLAVLLLTAAASILLAPPVRPAPQLSLSLETWRGSEAERDAMVSQGDALLRAARAQLATPLARTVRAQISAWLRREQGLSQEAAAADPEVRRALGTVEESVRTLYLTQGADAVRALAVGLGREVRAALGRAVAAATARHQSLTRLLSEEPLAPEAKTLLDLAGGLGQSAAAAGIGHRGTLDAEEGLVVEALTQQRIYALGVRCPGPAPELPSDLGRLLLRFRVESPEIPDLSRKFELLRALETEDPTYPSDYTRGVLLTRAQRCDLAIPVFLRAAREGQSPRQARANAQWCREHLANAAH